MKSTSLLVTAAILTSLAAAAHADFIDGNLALLRVNGAGTGPTSSQATSLSLLIYNSAGSLVHTIDMPSTGSSAITLEGTSGNHDGHLNLTNNGQYLLFAGYRANVGAADPSAALAADANRLIVRVDSDFNVDSSTALNNSYNNTQITAVASLDGSAFYTVGSGSYDVAGNTFYTNTGGLRYVNALGNSASVNLSQTQTTGGSPQVDSYRSLRIQTDIESGSPTSRLYLSTASQGSFVNRGAFTTRITMPTAGAQTIDPVITGTEGAGPDPTEKFFPKSDVVFLDLDPLTDGFDTAYSTGGKADYQKWAKVGSTWTRLSNLSLAGVEINAFDFTTSGNTVTLYASTDGGVYRLIDTAGYNSPISAPFSSTPFITSDANTQFRGIAIFGPDSAAATPVPEPTSLALLSLAALPLLRRKRA